MTTTYPRVLVAGGGIGGIAAALAILKHNPDVQVFEQALELKEVGAGVQISPNGNRALHWLGVFERLRTMSSNADSKVVRLWNTGRTWPAFDFGDETVRRFGYPYLTVYRPDLLQVLAEAVDSQSPGAIRLGRKVISFSQTSNDVTLHFEDGQSVSGDILIGADGVHSKVREGLGERRPPKFSGLVAWRGTIPMSALPARMNRSIATVWLGPNGHIVHYPLRGGKLMNFVATIERGGWHNDSWSARGSNEECVADFAGWHEDVTIMMRAAPTLFKWALMQRPELDTWTAGRVTLLGDACHPTLPLLAQGAVMALEDAVVLGRSLAMASDPVAALIRYERARKDVTRRKVAGAFESLSRFHNEAFVSDDRADPVIEREWGREAVERRYTWMFAEDITTDPI